MVDWAIIESLVLEAVIIVVIGGIVGLVAQLRKNARQQVMDNTTKLKVLSGRVYKLEHKVDEIRKCVIVMAKIADKTTNKVHK